MIEFDGFRFNNENILIDTLQAQMGGHGHGFLRDEAIDKWGTMRENTWRHFR